MIVEVAGYAFLDANALTDQQKANIRHLLTIYPSRTSEHDKEDPPPIPLFMEDDERGLFGVPWQFYLNNRKQSHNEVIDVSDGGPMHKFESLMTFKGDYAEQDVAINVLINQLRESPFNNPLDLWCDCRANNL